MRMFLHRLLYFNTCFLIGGTICEGFRGAALLGSIPLGTDRLSDPKSTLSNLLSLFCACNSRCELFCHYHSISTMMGSKFLEQ